MTIAIAEVPVELGALEDRTFVFLSSGQTYAPRDGFTAVHRATAIGQAGALHVYELVRVPR